MNDIHAQAPVADGIEIYYTKTGKSAYRITAHVYRNCQTGSLNNLNGFVIADTFRIPLNFKRIAIQRIDDTCKNPCQNINAKGNAGYEKHTYTDTVNFSTSPFDSILKAGLCQVKFAVHQQLRNPAITTHSLTNNMLYNDAMADICSPSDQMHSPVFSFEPRMVVSCNNQIIYTPAPIDTMDFDSLGFELDAVQHNFNKLEAYTGNFTKLIPMTPYCPPNPGVINCRALPNAKPPRGIYFDPELCQLIVTPTKCDEVATIVFKVSEYRRDSSGKFKLLGYVRREMVITIKMLPDNIPPYMTGQTKFSVCGNNQLCLNSAFKDEPFLPKQTILDTVHIKWNHGIPGAVFKLNDSGAREKTTLFCWKAKPHYKNERLFFAIQSFDKRCNAYTSSYNFYIQTRPETQYKTFNTLKSCGKILFGAMPLDSNEVLQGSISIGNGSKVFYTTNKLQDSASVPDNGTFYITYALKSNVNPNCIVTRSDTVFIDNTLAAGFSHTSKDTLVCKSYPAKLQFAPSKHKYLLNWAWYRNDTLYSTTDSVVQSDIYSKTSFRLNLFGNNGCNSIAERTFTPYNNTADLLPLLFSICDSIKATLTPNINLLKQPVKYQWKLRNTDTFSTGKLSFYPKNNEKVYLKAVDDNHCKVSDSVQMRVHKLPYFRLDKRLLTHTICKNGQVTLPADSFTVASPFTIRWQVNGKDSNAFKNKKSLVFYLKDAAVVKVSVTDANACLSSDSMHFDKPEFPLVTLVDTGKHCTGVPFKVHAKVRNSVYQKPLYSWSVNGNLTNPQVWDSVKTYTAYSNFNLQVFYYGRYGCSDDTLITVNVLPNPVFRISGDTAYNKAHFIVLSTGKDFDGYRWFNGNNSKENSFWASELGPPGAYKVWCTVNDSNGCSSNDTLLIFTDRRLSTAQHPVSGIRIYPNPFQSTLLVESPDDHLLQLYAANGQLLISMPLGAGLNRIETSDLPAGLYLICIGQHRETLLKH